MGQDSNPDNLFLRQDWNPDPRAEIEVIAMANILLGVTGSVAAMYTGALFQELKQAGHAVKVVATSAAQYC